MTTAVLVTLIVLWAAILVRVFVAGQACDARMASGLWVVATPGIFLAVGAGVVLLTHESLLSLILAYWWFPVTLYAATFAFILTGCGAEFAAERRRCRKKEQEKVA